MFDHVRVRGRGSWYREPEGGWSLKNFRIEGFDPLSDATLSEALEDIRKLNLNRPGFTGGRFV
jgi:hypothetical protein